MTMFQYNPGIHDEDDVIQYLLSEMIKPDYAGGCLQVPGYLRINDYDYDRFMEPTVREKMYQYGVAKRCTGMNQPETAIMITPKGIKIGRQGGWKAFLISIEQEAIAHKKEILAKEELNRQAVQAQQRPIVHGNNNVYNSGSFTARDLKLGDVYPSDLTTQSSKNIPEQKPKAKSLMWDKIPDWAKIISGLGALAGLAKLIIEIMKQ